MAWFLYGDIGKNSHKKGVWLRTRALPDDILKALKGMGCDTDLFHLERVVVSEVLVKLGWARLEVWSWSKRMLVKRSRLARRLHKRLERLAEGRHDGPPIPTESYRVFQLLAKENPKWVCESDMGRGLVRAKEA